MSEHNKDTTQGLEGGHAVSSDLGKTKPNKFLFPLLLSYTNQPTENSLLIKDEQTKENKHE